jgi:hypothetical protein
MMLVEAPLTYLHTLKANFLQLKVKPPSTVARAIPRSVLCYIISATSLFHHSLLAFYVLSKSIIVISVSPLYSALSQTITIKIRDLYTFIPFYLFKFYSEKQTLDSFKTTSTGLFAVCRIMHALFGTFLYLFSGERRDKLRSVAFFFYQHFNNLQKMAMLQDQAGETIHGALQ